ncbi:hypothetical protein MMC07_006958 [Pseudocyphellaria aurata]|nr:hypothetical protein [Pseudocyphellaria aurata]
MRRIRLSIQVLPWQNSSVLHGYRQNTRPEVILPWIEPCTEDISLQELSERITSRFASIHRGKGCVVEIPRAVLAVLNIECLQNYWGCVLDMPLTVGEVFDDLHDNSDISRSIVKVVRSPPTPDELENPLRYVSLAPESSARPQKRRLTQLPAATLDERHRGGYVSRWDSDSLVNDDGRTSKRLKLEHSSSHAEFGSDRSIFPSEGLQHVVFNSSQTSAGHMSPIRQVADSPRPSSRKKDDFYGTPTSLSINSPHRTGLSKPYDSMAIPDSPNRGEASSTDGNIKHTTSLERHALRRESPELGSMIYRDPLDGSDTKFAEPLQADAVSPTLILRPLKNGSDRLGDHPAIFGCQDAREDQNPLSKVDSSSTAENGSLPIPPIVPTLRQPNGTVLRMRHIIGPTGKDSEQPYERPKLSSIKQTQSEKFAPEISSTEDHERSKRDEKAIAKEIKSSSVVARNGGKQCQAPDTQNKKSALERISRLQNRAASKVPQRTGDEGSVKEKSESVYPTEGGARQFHVENENSEETSLAEDTEVIRPEKETEVGDVEPIELATIAKRADEIAEKKNLRDKGANKAKLVDEAISDGPTDRNVSGLTLTDGNIAENIPGAASAETNAGINKVETRLEPSKREEATPKERSGKNQSAILAEDKKSVRGTKKRQAEERLKKSFKSGEDSKDKTLRESKEPLPVRQMNVPQSENSPAASGSIRILNSEDRSSEHSTKSNILENSQVQSEVMDPSISSSAIPKTPKKVNLSNTRSQNFKTPLGTRIEPDRMRQSMTPPYPSSLTSKQKPKSSAPSHGKPLKSDPPPRSAIRQTSSPARRSVSFAEDSTAISEAQRGTALSDTKPSKRGTSSVMMGVEKKNATEALNASQVSKKSSKQSETPTTNHSQNRKRQSKLEFHRDKKLKGRMIDPPVSSEPATQPEIVISSDSEFSVSSFYSQDDMETRNARPGPSKRRHRNAPVEPSKETPRMKVISDSVPAKQLTKLEITRPSAGSPEIDCPKEKLLSSQAVILAKEKSSPGAKVHQSVEESSSTPVANIDPQILSAVPSSERSSPRAPAQYMSRAVSISSSSTSNASGSDSDENNSPPVETKQQSGREETRPDSIVPNSTAGGEMPYAKSVSLNRRQPSSRLSKAPPVISPSSESTSSSNSKRIERAAEEQLQRESRQSKESSQALRSASSISTSAADKKSTRSRVLPSPRTNSDFPRMTDLMRKQSVAVTSSPGDQRSSHRTPSKPVASKRATLSPFRVSGSSSDGYSSSGSGSSGSSSDEEEDT